MLDPLRPQVPAAITRVHRAGIRIHVVTGDNRLTAAAIARRAGIGVAMRRSGTDVAREAATTILTDDNFATIAAAVGNAGNDYRWTHRGRFPLRPALSPRHVHAVSSRPRSDSVPRASAPRSTPECSRAYTPLALRPVTVHHHAR
jgi:hypothetical protein